MRCLVWASAAVSLVTAPAAVKRSEAQLVLDGCPRLVSALTRAMLAWCTVPSLMTHAALAVVACFNGQ